MPKTVSACDHWARCHTRTTGGQLLKGIKAGGQTVMDGVSRCKSPELSPQVEMDWMYSVEFQKALGVRTTRASGGGGQQGPKGEEELEAAQAPSLTPAARPGLGLPF